VYETKFIIDFKKLVQCRVKLFYHVRMRQSCI